MECALAKLKSNSGWRTTYTAGARNVVSSLTNALSGDECFEFVLVDADGDLADDEQDAVTVRSIGTAGNARHVLEVLLMPRGQGVSSLSASIHSAGNIDATAVITTNQVASANGNIACSGAGTISGNAQAGGGISGSVTGTKTQNMIPLLELPDPNSVFEYYLSNGTPIAAGQLSAGTIQNVLVSAASNPYGAHVTNSQGIYVINGGGNKITIRNCRIRGTLVFMNADVELRDSIVWETHVANFPALMVDGNLAMNWQSSTVLSESSLSVNFNPQSTPYQSTWNSDTADQYPGRISGLVYTRGNLTTLNRANITGVVVAGGSATLGGQMTLVYNSAFYNNAPPGFSATSNMQVVPGTWTQVSY
jgi:hypothetical protein